MASPIEIFEKSGQRTMAVILLYFWQIPEGCIVTRKEEEGESVEFISVSCTVAVITARGSPNEII